MNWSYQSIKNGLTKHSSVNKIPYSFRCFSHLGSLRTLIWLLLDLLMFDLPRLLHLVCISQILPIIHYSTFTSEHFDLTSCILFSAKYISTSILLHIHIIYCVLHVTSYNPYLLWFTFYLVSNTFYTLSFTFLFIHSL